MNINSYNNTSFGAIRVPLTYGSQQNLEKARKIASDVFFKNHATGITALDYYTMFFKNKKIEDVAENVLKAANIKYTRSDLVEKVSLEERNFWAVNGRFPSEEEIKEYVSDLLRRLDHHA